MQKKNSYDLILLLAVLAILVIGIVMIVSIGVPKSIHLSAPPDLAYPDCADPEVDCYLVLKNHLVRVFLGLIAMLVAWKLPYRLWKTFSFLIFLIGVGLLIFVLAAGDSNDTFATSWINFEQIPFINSLQPSEVAKFGLILYLSYFLSEKLTPTQLDDWREGFLKFAIISSAVMLPIILQPDYGSAMVIGLIAISIYFLSGANWRHFVIGALVALMLGTVAWSTQEHIRTRVMGFFSPDAECVEGGSCWQMRQANISIGSGGFWGKGLTQGVQKAYWLPQASDDFIFAASAEELGFVRSAAIVLLYCLIAYRSLQITYHAPNKFTMLVAGGVSVWISAQAFINIMVNTALFPVTGITLPFMSYGGSSMLTTLAAVGLLLNISQYTTDNAYSSNRWGDRWTRRSQPRYYSRYTRPY